MPAVERSQVALAGTPHGIVARTAQFPRGTRRGLELIAVREHQIQIADAILRADGAYNLVVISASAHVDRLQIRSLPPPLDTNRRFRVDICRTITSSNRLRRNDPTREDRSRLFELRIEFEHGAAGRRRPRGQRRDARDGKRDHPPRERRSGTSRQRTAYSSHRSRHILKYRGGSAWRKRVREAYCGLPTSCLHLRGTRDQRRP